VLELDRVGIHDPFLELGGDSLRAMRILSRVLDAFEVELLPSDLFKTPTVAEMASLVAQANGK
jgi:acyl carrier protein